MNKTYSEVIQFAWSDNKSFEEIYRYFGFTEDKVIKIMRKSLKPKSFKLWRKRVSGRLSKHQKKSKLQSHLENCRVNLNEAL